MEIIDNECWVNIDENLNGINLVKDDDCTYVAIEFSDSNPFINLIISNKEEFEEFKEMVAKMEWKEEM